MPLTPPAPAFARGLRRIASASAGLVRAIGRSLSAPWPQQSCECRSGEEMIARARERAQRWF